MAITEQRIRSADNSTKGGSQMPILMIALFALACFGLIGILLAAAVACEHKKPAHPAHDPAGKPVAR
jgi:hypothetical protein